MVVLTRQVLLNLGMEQLPAPLLTGQNLPDIIVTVVAIKAYVSYMFIGFVGNA